MVRARTQTCDVRSHKCVCVRNPFCKVCEMCVRADLFWTCDVRSHFCTLFGTKLPENATFCLKRMILEHPFLLWNIFSCFGSGACVRPKKGSQLTPWKNVSILSALLIIFLLVFKGDSGLLGFKESTSLYRIFVANI